MAAPSTSERTHQYSESQNEDFITKGNQSLSCSPQNPVKRIFANFYNKGQLLPQNICVQLHLRFKLQPYLSP
jgi:hypothetical protein